MSDLRDLYQEVILDHSKRPRNAALPEGFTHDAHGHNPLCGDQLHLALILDEAGVVQDIGFEGSGCAISQAAASTMTEVVKGKPYQEAVALFEAYHAVVTGEDPFPDPDTLGKLAVFAGVAEFPMRVKCATLAWHTLQSAVGDSAGVVTTE